MIISYLKFLLRSKNEHSIHSPFVFELYTQIIINSKIIPTYLEIEKYRKAQLKNSKTIEIKDFGAGSKHNKSNFRKISEIAQNAEKGPRFGQLLFRLVEYFNPKLVFDLGTSLGITTLYQSKALPVNAQIITFEGCPQTANEAKILFENTEPNNIKQIIGNIDDTLPKQLSSIENIDFVFFDANHRLEPTLRYFNLCLSKVNEQTIFVFDDIHWSAEMEQAWQQIKDHPKVMITIDLFYMGLVFFRTNQPKQDFILRY